MKDINLYVQEIFLAIREYSAKQSECIKLKQAEGLCISNSHFKKLQKDHEDISSEKKKLSQVCDEIKALELKNSESVEKKKNLHLKINQENERVLQKTQEVDDLKTKYASLESSIETQEDFVNKLKEKNQVVNKEMKKNLDLFKRHLGVNISHTNHGTLVIMFTQICKRDPLKEYMLEFSLSEDNRYNLIQSVPRIDRLKEFEQTLNKTNNFDVFLLFLRDLFCNM